jgi:hypothetical protein
VRLLWPGSKLWENDKPSDELRATDADCPSSSIGREYVLLGSSVRHSKRNRRAVGSDAILSVLRFEKVTEPPASAELLNAIS